MNCNKRRATLALIKYSLPKEIHRIILHSYSVLTSTIGVDNSVKNGRW